jgi:hypothetical protein
MLPPASRSSAEPPTLAVYCKPRANQENWAKICDFPHAVFRLHGL